MSRAVVRGIGAFTPAGRGPEAVAAHEGGAKIVGTPTESPNVRVARGQLETTEGLLPSRKLLRMLSRGVHWGVVAAVEALRDAGIEDHPVDEHRFGIFASGFTNVEEFVHLHAVMKKIQSDGQDWRECFGAVATVHLPSFMLLRRLPNAAFCHVAQLAHARGANATLLTGTVSALDCLRHAAMAINVGRLDAAMIVAYDAPITWEVTTTFARIVADKPGSVPVVLGEGGIALYLEREDLRPASARRSYARVVSGAAAHAQDGIVCFTRSPIQPPRTLERAILRATSRALLGRDQDSITHLDTGDVGIDWWDQAEQAARSFATRAQRGSATGRTGHLGLATGAVGLARISYELSRIATRPSAGLVVRASPTGQCSSALLCSI